jgi:hypothetical protein
MLIGYGATKGELPWQLRKIAFCRITFVAAISLKLEVAAALAARRVTSCRVLYMYMISCNLNDAEY